MPKDFPNNFNQPKPRGISWVWFVLIIVAMLGSGYFAWWYYQANKERPVSNDSQNFSNSSNTNSANNSNLNNDIKENEQSNYIVGEDDGKKYTDSIIGFSFEHEGIPLVLDNPKYKGVYLSVEAQEISKIGDLPSSWGTKEALEDKAALEKGLTNVRTGWRVDESIKLLDIEGAVGKTQFYPASFDTTVANIAMMAIIYMNDYRVVVSLTYNNADELVENNPNYFISKKTEDSFSDWKDSGMTEFYSDLVGGNTDPITQDWYKSFNEIIRSFEVTK